MTIAGIIFLCIGFGCWIVGATWLSDRTLKRYGMERRKFPFSPSGIPFRKFNRQDWWLLAAIFMISMLFLNVGRALLSGT